MEALSDFRQSFFSFFKKNHLSAIFQSPRLPPLIHHGVQFHQTPESYLCRILHTQGDYEPELLNVLMRILRPDDVFVDVGASEGYFSMHASRRVGRFGKVISIEPHPEAWKIWRINSKNNPFSAQVLYRVALSEQKKELLYFGKKSNTGSSSFFPIKTKWFRKKAWVPCMALRQVVEREGGRPIRALKMDIEGAEWGVLRGSRALLESGQIECLIIEMHPPQIELQGGSVEALEDFIEDCGYHRKEIGQKVMYLFHPHQADDIETLYLPQYPLLRPVERPHL